MQSYAILVKFFMLSSHIWMTLSADHGYFWHISDLHVDQNYSRSGNPFKMCHHEAKAPPQDNGLYGNFLCDAPEYLINYTIQSMKEIHDSPDFIIWTGDDLPHTGASPEWNITFEAIKNITGFFTSVFPNVSVLPSIGNHDTFPTNVLPVNNESESIYRGYLEKGGWNELLSQEECSTFLLGGFYSRVVKPGLRIISLNTILWYSANPLTSELEDPAGQFQWLTESLSNSSGVSEKVYIIGHVPPGFYNRVIPGDQSNPTFHPEHLEAYIKILRNYSEIIIGQLYGHFHLDMFQVYQYDTGSFKGSALLASSVSPWHEIDKYNVSIPVNPSIRLMHYSLINGTLLDYDQYFLNLSKANNMNETHQEQVGLYEPLYTFTKHYGVPDLSTESLVEAYEMIRRNETMYDSFFTFLTAGKQSVNCDAACKVAQICSMSCSSMDEYDMCMQYDYPWHTSTFANLTGLYIGIVALIAVSVSVYFLYQRFGLFRQKREYFAFSQF